MSVSSSDHVALQRPQVQKLAGFLDLIRQEAWLATERFAAQYGAGCNIVSQGLDRVSCLFLRPCVLSSTLMLCYALLLSCVYMLVM